MMTQLRLTRLTDTLLTKASISIEEIEEWIHTNHYSIQLQSKLDGQETYSIFKDASKFSIEITKCRCGLISLSKDKCVSCNTDFDK